MIENGTELILNGTEIRLGIWHPIFIPHAKQLVLPLDNIRCRNLRQTFLLKIRNDFCVHNVPLRQKRI